ncbi:5'-nucleotidase, lipoprotein e(P4) family [Mucilaginibacter myungsuensis]|uniref:5'-nucleotidase, lipoprotein e(P4) family n=1 Tax=Mucilaginibacter myungsuensis TaxID=649104 RepID=A0A929L154_9SPHI|nr:5'-nucleotidase, lipoprotein e(P4) family [Mucilaginibacter myungsuensis]MBE9662594.1 5'-nucleotidase, lipoprotein e(P4) family [Mucilaginibacter myungsuensis]MDN3598014.1 5'-nucleotidase, lipoprotein e(P4) family [Mucilaginibacter myungsuensis]
MKLKLSLSIAVLCLTANAFAQDKSLSTVNAGKAWAAIYQQRSAEYKALCFQAYNIAKFRLDEAIKHKGKKPLALVTDIDETLLDNSPEGARAALANQDFNTKDWKTWTAKGIADTVSGAAAFFKYAAKKGVTVFYITNRDQDERDGTLKNLKTFNLPFADDAHLLLKSGTSSKEARRQMVLAKYNIVLLCGDNLPDFDLLYDNKPTEEARMATTEKLKAEFGKKFIVIPNPSYGDFEGALFKFNYKLTPAQKDSVIMAKLKVSQ